MLGLGTPRRRKNNFLNLFKEKFRKTNLDLQNLISVCTNSGAPVMKGKHEKFVVLLQKKKLTNADRLMPFHCILHQQNL